MSIYRPDHKTIFIHVPKTAGSAMEQQNFLGGGGHVWIEDFKRRFWAHGRQEMWSVVFKWGFVRNPWDRFVSVYFRWPPTKNRPEHFRKFVLGEFRETGFDVPKMKINKWKLHHHFLPQHHFLCVGGSIGVDFVGRFEDLQNDWSYVCRRAGVPHRELPVVNKGAHKPYQEYYDPDTAAVIGEMYERDAELFGYSFEEEGK